MSDLTVTHTTNEAGHLTVTLGGNLTIDTVAELHELLKEQIPGASTVMLDTAALETIDLTGIQLICSSCWTLQLQGIALRFCGYQTSCLAQAITDYGLNRHTACKHNPQKSCIMCGGMN